MRKPLLLAALLCACVLMSCATLGKVVRTIDVVARDICEIWGTQQGEAALGMSPEKWCSIPGNVDPFIPAARAAVHAGGSVAGARLHAQ